MGGGQAMTCGQIAELLAMCESSTFNLGWSQSVKHMVGIEQMTVINCVSDSRYKKDKETRCSW